MLNFLSPVSENHSIGRAISTVFFPQEVLKPELLFNKIRDNFNGKYAKKGPLITRDIIIENKNNQTITKRKEQITGFVFEEFDKQGKLKNVLKLENAGKQFSLRFETRSYDNWSDFKDSFINDFQVVSNAQNMFIEAFSLTYIDEFRWLSDNKIPTEKIFNSESELISNRFLDSINGNMVLHNQSVSRGYLSEERIDISFSNDLKRVSLNHQAVNKLDDIYSLEELLKDGSLISRFDDAHQRNKNFLKENLTKEVQMLIGLIKE